MSWWSKHVQEPLQKAVHDVAPYVAVAVAIFAPELIPRLGYSLGATSSAGAAAAGSAALAGGTTALAGGTPEQVAKSAALAGAGSYAGAAGSKSLGLSGTAGAAAGGAISGGTQAALTGKDVGKAALKGGATAGLSSELQSAYQSTLPQNPAQGLSGSTSFSSAGDYRDPFYQSKGSGLDLKALSTSFENTDATTGAVDYSMAPSGNEASGIGLQAPDKGSVYASTAPPLSSADKAIADYIAKYTVNKLSPASKPAASQTSSVAMGSQQSPTAAGAADVAMLDSTSPEGIGSKTGKKGGKYPWGDPEGTTALKQEGQGI
jgi:hypothetical protein